MTAPAGAQGSPGRRVPPTVALAVVVLAAGVVVSVWRPWATPFPPVATDLDRLAPDVAAAIAEYRAPRRLLGRVLDLLAVAVPVLVVATSAGRRLLARLAGSRTEGWRGPLRGGAVGGLVVALGHLVALPVLVWAGIVQDGTWGVRTASASAWWGRVLTSMALEVGTVALLGAAAVWLLRRRPTTWAWDAVVLGVLGVAVATVVWPAVVLPATTPVRPLGEGEVPTAVRSTLEAAGLGDLPVVVQERSARDTRSNAVVHGLGPTRRVVVDDTLLARPVDEVVAVVAHELAHQRHADVERAVLASGLLVAVLAGGVHVVWGRPVRRRVLTGVGAPLHDPRVVAVALAVAAVVGLLAEPVALWHSRRVEAAADDAAFTLGADPDTTVRLQRRLAIDNLTPLDVPTWELWWSWSHPSGASRIQASVARATATGAPMPTLEALLAEESGDPPSWSRPGQR